MGIGVLNSIYVDIGLFNSWDEGIGLINIKDMV